MGFFSNSNNESEEGYVQARERMVANQIAARDVADPRVLEAMRRVSRHLFVPPELRRDAYDDSPLSIGHGQTISQPYIVASMTEYLSPDRDGHILEIGTGSGYQTAILAELSRQVDTVEFVPDLSRRAQTTLRRLGYANITFHIGNGLEIPREPAQFDGIIVTAAPREFPESLSARLRSGGRIVIPVGDYMQVLILATKDEAGRLHKESLYGVRFVNLQK